jgi:hypothetical protein
VLVGTSGDACISRRTFLHLFESVSLVVLFVYELQLVAGLTLPKRWSGA